MAALPISPMSDHDLLITLNENVSYMRTDLISMRSEITGRISDHEARIRVIEATQDRTDGAISASRAMILVISGILAIVQVIEVWYIGVHK